MSSASSTGNSEPPRRKAALESDLTIGVFTNKCLRSHNVSFRIFGYNGSPAPNSHLAPNPSNYEQLITCRR